MNAGKWFGVGKAWVDPETGCAEWPEEAQAAWAEHVRERVGVDASHYCWAGRRERHPMKEYSLWVFFPADFPMSGHLCSIRKLQDNLSLIHYGHFRAQTHSSGIAGYFGVGGMMIRSKYVLRKLAEVSPLFVPIWEDLKDISPDERGFYLAEAPDEGWLVSIEPDEARLLAEFRDGIGASMVGMRSILGSAEGKERVAAFKSVLILKSPEEVKEGFTKAVEEEPDAIEYWEGYFDYLVEIGQMNFYKKLKPLEQAHDWVERALRQYPDCALLDRMRATCCLNLGAWEKAQWHLDRFLAVNPWDNSAMLLNAKLAMFNRDWKLAAQRYAECAEHRSLSEIGLLDWARALRGLQRSDDAVAVIQVLEERWPKLAAVWKQYK